MNLPQANAMVPVNDLRNLNEALRKATDAGYQTPSSGGGDIGPLMPQSIEGQLASATYTMEELVLWPRIPKRGVTQTVHEYVRVEEHGNDLDPFIAEGGGGTNNNATYTKEFVKVKYLAERREVTDVATMVGIIGNNSDAMAEETERGTLRLMGKVESALFHADENLNDLHFSGLLPQIRDKAPQNVTDLEGAHASPSLIQSILGEVFAAPRYGKPDAIYVEPRVHAALIEQANAHGRHDQVQVTNNTGITYGVQHLKIMAPYGAVPVVAAPFLFRQYAPPDAAFGEDPPTALSWKTQPVHDAALSGTSKWSSSDEGDFYWKVVGVGDEGYTAPLVSAATSVEADDKIKMEIDDGAVVNGKATNGAKYYRVYRSEQDGAAATCRFVFEVKVNADGTDDATLITDLHTVKRNTSSMLFLQHDPRIVEVVRLLDLLRRPLAEVKTTRPFLLMMFMAPEVKVASKCWVVDGVGSPAPLEAAL